MKLLRNKLSITLIGAALLAPLAFIPAPAAKATASTEWPDFEETTFAYAPLSAPATLDRAETLADSATAENIVGYRYENPEIVGEFFITPDQTAESFQANFEATFGTQPQITSMIYIIPIDQVTSQADSALTPIETGESPFQAPPIAADVAEEMVASVPANDPSIQATQATHNWTPQVVDASTWRTGTTQNFALRMSWGPNKPTNLDGNYGIEFEMNLYNDGSTNMRPFCSAGYKDRFIAKREGWLNWYMTAPTGQGLANANPYADYNDLSDECRINSMALGVQYGNRIPPHTSGAYSLLTGIVAPIGTQNSNPVGGVIQSVNNTSCIFGGALTDCMGVTPGSQGSQLFLNYTRGENDPSWAASPNLCWYSTNYGGSVQKIAC